MILPAIQPSSHVNFQHHKTQFSVFVVADHRLTAEWCVQVKSVRTVNMAQVVAHHFTEAASSLRQRVTRTFTLQEAVAALMRAGLRNPFRVNVAVQSGQGEDTDASAGTRKTPLSLDITYTIIPGNEKVPQLLAFLASHSDKKVIVYFLTCASVEYFSSVLPSLPGGASNPLLALHGSLKQKKVSSDHVVLYTSVNKGTSRLGSPITQNATELRRL